MLFLVSTRGEEKEPFDGVVGFRFTESLPSVSVSGAVAMAMVVQSSIIQNSHRDSVLHFVSPTEPSGIGGGRRSATR